MPKTPAPAPLWLKLALTCFVAFLVPYYWQQYGWQNFLWLSDISLFLTVAALWRRSRLIISMMAIGIMPLELFWNLDYFTRLISGIQLTGLSEYMFDDSRPLLLRAVSLFHVALPVIWIIYLRRWGYDRRALAMQTLLLWTTLVATRLLTRPDDNVNWVFAPYSMGWAWLSEWAWLVAFMAVVPLAIHWPLHTLYSRRLGNDG